MRVEESNVMKRSAKRNNKPQKIESEWNNRISDHILEAVLLNIGAPWGLRHWEPPSLRCILALLCS